MMMTDLQAAMHNLAVARTENIRLIARIKVLQDELKGIKVCECPVDTWESEGGQ